MISHIDHLVLTVRSIEASCDFYVRALGLEREAMPNGHISLRLGRCKLNLHQADHTFDPKAAAPTPGSGDFCLITEDSLEDIAAQIQSAGFEIELGPVERTGALATMDSIYLRDPDANLVEISRYRAAVL